MYIEGKLNLGLQGHTDVQILNPIRNGKGVSQCTVFSGYTWRRTLVVLRSLSVD